jgi:hypothetical protein
VLPVFVFSLGCPQKDPRHRGGTFFGFGCCEAWTEVWCLVAVPELVAADLFVGSDVGTELGVGVVLVLVVQHAISLFLVLAGNSRWPGRSKLSYPAFLFYSPANQGAWWVLLQCLLWHGLVMVNPFALQLPGNLDVHIKENWRKYLVGSIRKIGRSLTTQCTSPGTG